MFLLYNILLTLLAPIWVPWMWLRTKARKAQPNWNERFGKFEFASDPSRKRIWFHAVSVGEVIAALPILERLRAKLPDHEIFLSTTTSSGHSTAEDKAKPFVDHIIYFPIDVARFQLGAIQRIQPSVVAIMETELWFNFLWAAKVFDCRTMLVNGRISDRSFPRSMKIRFFYRALLKEMDRCLMQSDSDRERIVELGATEAEVFGNCKFDEAATKETIDLDSLRAAFGIDSSVSVIVVGSTRGAEEEDFVIAALPQRDCQIIYAPRHIERADEVAAKLSRKFGGVVKRSSGKKGRITVLDTYGELATVYAVADIVIIGGGFENLGGQNLIQPLALGKPVLHGPHMQNFKDVTAMSLAAGSSIACKTPEELKTAIDRLLSDPEGRQRMGNAAADLVRANLGASERYAEAIAQEARTFVPT